VSRWKGIVSLLCLALWLPATQHCQLEKLPGLSFLQCAGDSDGRECQGDSCDVVERGVYKAPDCSDVACGSVAELLDNPPALEAEPAQPACLEHLDSDVRVLLPESWQLYSVAAAPIRGPSLPS
jgi:hypothetical protein